MGQIGWLVALVAGAGAAYAAGEGGQLELLDARLMRLEIEERRIDLQRDRESACWPFGAGSGPHWRVW